jgi:hypothetical protein
LCIAFYVGSERIDNLNRNRIKMARVRNIGAVIFLNV